MYYLISSLINFVTSFALALLVYFGNPRGKLNKAFTAFLISISIWAFGYSLWQFYQHVSPSGEKALFWIRFGMIGAIVIPITFTEFVIRFVNQEKRYQLIRKINIAIGLFLILSSGDQLTHGGLRQRADVEDAVERQIGRGRHQENHPD